MTSRTATAPRVTGGRPATMTRTAVQQARTQSRSTTPTPSLDLPELPSSSTDGWVNVEHHKRKHKQGTTGRVRSDTNGREMRRTQSAIVSTSSDREEPPMARSNARADALSAAVTMDKKARERSYYSSGGATSPPGALSLSTSMSWGSPPPPPGLEGPRGIPRSHMTEAPAMPLTLERTSSLDMLMASWQLPHDPKDAVMAGGTARGGSRPSAKPNPRPGGDVTSPLGGIFDFSFTDFGVEPPNITLRRTQSDVVQPSLSLPSGTNRQRSPNGRVQDPKNNHTNGSNNPNGTTTRKCGDKRDFFFRNLDYETRNLLQIDDVASFSVTDFEMARKISSAIVDMFPEMKMYVEQQAAADAFMYGLSDHDPSFQAPRKYPLIITDATACVGGNVLSFCDFFHFVYAIENDATRVSMLENNLRVLNKTNVACRCASYLDVMYEYHQDVIFFDPPWGGPEYKDQDKVDLYLDEQPLYEICEQLHGYAKVIVLKVPTNFDDEKFAYCVSGRVTVRKDFKKMHLVVLDFR